ncbi:MAG: ABC transporter ATP-binding protein [Ignavibacteriae bacterium]|nr:MAG: ABC transporter ATP-binding protein [Ignavibacteriota bacterium]
MNESIIEVQNLAKTYHKRGHTPVHALKGISFSVQKGQIFGLLGPNGAGKSTTIKILTTLIVPTSGKAAVCGHDVVAQSTDVRKQICAVIQDNALEIYLSVRNNFKTFGKFHGISAKEIDRRTDRLCELFGLREYLNESGIDLSGGLKRRVQVAKMFLIDKPVVFLDEATTGMDTFNKRTTLNAIREESHKGRTILLTTHLLDEAEILCDAVTIINHGSILAQGNIEEVKSMGLQLYTVSMTCQSDPAAWRRWIEQCAPVSIEQSENSFIVTVATEDQALDMIQRARAAGVFQYFEISRTSLEDTFIELIDKKTERKA